MKARRSELCKRPLEEEHVQLVWRIVVQAGPWQVNVARQRALHLFDVLARISCALGKGLLPGAPHWQESRLRKYAFDSLQKLRCAKLRVKVEIDNRYRLDPSRT